MKVLILGLLCILAACDRAPGLGKPTFQGVDITGANYAQTLSLPDATGKMRSLDEFKGKVVVVFFGYVQCPDVCPTTLSELATVKQDLGKRAAELQPIFVTIDPERDTPEILSAYMSNFGPDFLALRGSLEATQEAAKAFKVFFAKVPGKDAGSYTMDHTAAAFLFDRAGRVRVFSRYGVPGGAMAADIKQLLAEP